MDFETVRIEKRGDIAVVTLSRPDCLNAFNYTMMEELTEVARLFRNDHDTHAIVLTGEGRAFSAGFDLRQSSPTGSVAKRRALHHRGRHMCRAWEELPQTTIAAIHGPAVGAGVAIALCCDWRVMSRDSYLYVPEIRIGLTLQMQAIPRLVALVGPARAKRIVMLCEKMPALQALEWGIADELAAPGEDMAVALRLAEQACAMPPAIMTMSKEAINAVANANLHATSFMDADVSMLVFDLDDAVKARAPFKAKAGR
jgi:enoyl-CoA hydratase/carnithine racemase